MALAVCNECGGSCSEYAETCPHCGKPNPVQSALEEKSETFLAVLYVLMFIGLLMFGAYAALKDFF
tara:strand:+ start:325 stop:522 length:198 start_codon:yes stop_codon:yes gene_type:complete